MASLQPSNSNLAFYLTDRVDTPLVLSTTPQSPSSQSQALKDLTEIAIKTYSTASRLELGLPQRVMISTTFNGPLILHSYLNPMSTSQTSNFARGIIESTRDELRPFTATTASSDLDGDRGEGTLVNGVNGSRVAKETEEESGVNTAPLLIGTVVASRAEEAGDARRAAARLEKIGGDFQRAWIKEQEEGDEAATVEQG